MGLFHVHNCIGHKKTSAGHFIQNWFHHPVTFLPLTAGAQRIRLQCRGTQLRPAPCVACLCKICLLCAKNCLFRFAKISFGLHAHDLWRNALLNFVKFCSRPYVCATQADSLLINGESARKCRIGLLGSDAFYNSQTQLGSDAFCNSQTFVRQKLILTNKMTHFKLYMKVLKKFSCSFILARGLFTFGHLLMITL